jgi:hypothetical protein
MSHITAKFVPYLLNENQKQKRTQISDELLARAETDKDFSKNINTGDETWIYGYDIETKRQSSQWKLPSSPRTTQYSNTNLHSYTSSTQQTNSPSTVSKLWDTTKYRRPLFHTTLKQLGY